MQFRRGTLDLEPALATSWDISADQRTYTFHSARRCEVSRPHGFDRRATSTPTTCCLRSTGCCMPTIRSARRTQAAFPYFSDLGFDRNIGASEGRCSDRALSAQGAGRDLRAQSRDELRVDSVGRICGQAERGASRGGIRSVAGRERGRFVFRSYQKDALIRYDANPVYWRPDDVKLAHLIFAITPDPAVRMQKLAATNVVSVFPRPADLEVVKRNAALTAVSRRRLQCGLRRLQHATCAAQSRGSAPRTRYGHRQTRDHSIGFFGQCKPLRRTRCRLSNGRTTSS